MLVGILTICGDAMSIRYDPNQVLLQRGISDELAYKDYIFNDADYKVLQAMLCEINLIGYRFHYLSEIEARLIPGIGEIVLKYINIFISEATRAYLIPQLVFNKVNECDKLVLEMYMHFKKSNEYISIPGASAPAHIYVRYDNAFKKLKSKRIIAELLDLVVNPRDAFYLPLTTKMLASWKVPEMKEILMSYLDGSKITISEIGIHSSEDVYYPSLIGIKQQLKFIAIDGLKHYAAADTISLLKKYAHSDNADIKRSVQKTLKYLETSKK